MWPRLCHDLLWASCPSCQEGWRTGPTAGCAQPHPHGSLAERPRVSLSSWRTGCSLANPLSQEKDRIAVRSKLVRKPFSAPPAAGPDCGNSPARAGGAACPLLTARCQAERPLLSCLENLLQDQECPRARQGLVHLRPKLSCQVCTQRHPSHRAHASLHATRERRCRRGTVVRLPPPRADTWAVH